MVSYGDLMMFYGVCLYLMMFDEDLRMVDPPVNLRLLFDIVI